MDAIFIYALKSAFVLILLYVPYTLLLSKEDFFRMNRIVVLGILILSLVLPLCNVKPLSVDNQPIVRHTQMRLIEVGVPVHRQMETEDIWTAEEQRDEVNTVSKEQPFDWWRVLCVVYIIGMTMVLLVRIVQFTRMGAVIRKGCLWKTKENGITIFCHSEKVAPFSWLNNIVINADDYEEMGHEIILHENGHIRCHHSLDIILLTLVQMIQWWNPISYLLGRSLRDLHEYQADDYVLRQGVSIKGYVTLLIRKALDTSSYVLANNFNHSLIKKRVAMMKKNKSNPWMRCKIAFVLPMVVVALSAFATPEFVKPIEDVVQTAKATSQALHSDEDASQITPRENYTHDNITNKANSVSEKDKNIPPLVRYTKRDKIGKRYVSTFSISFPIGTWVEYKNGASFREEAIQRYGFRDKDTIKIDGVVIDRENIPDIPSTAARKIEIDMTRKPATINIITHDVVMPNSIKDNIPRVYTIGIKGHNRIGFLTQKVTKGEWIDFFNTSYEKDKYGYSIRNEFEHSKRKPDLKVYIYASNEATQREIDHIVSIMKELGISNYEISKNIPIKHWTDEECRSWATHQKEIHPEYNSNYLFDVLHKEEKALDILDFQDQWHIIKEVYGVK